MKNTTLRITGMHCASCAANTEAALKDIRGVSKASVNIATEKASVEYDPAVTGESELKKAIEKAGLESLLSEATGLDRDALRYLCFEY